jgi:hypothetical protein
MDQEYKALGWEHEVLEQRFEKVLSICQWPIPAISHSLIQQIQKERDELYTRFIKAIQEVQQKSNFKNLLLEKKLSALADTLEKKEAQLNEVLSASNLDPTALTVVTRKLEVGFSLCVVLSFLIRIIPFKGCA